MLFKSQKDRAHEKNMVIANKARLISNSMDGYMQLPTTLRYIDLARKRVQPDREALRYLDRVESSARAIGYVCNIQWMMDMQFGLYEKQMARRKAARATQ